MQSRVQAVREDRGSILSAVKEDRGSIQGWFNRNHHSDRNKVRFIMAGIYDGQVRTPKEIVEMTQSGELKEKFDIETEFNPRQLQRLVKTPYEMKGKLDYIIPAIRTQLQQYLNSEDLSSALSDANHYIRKEIS